MSERKVLIVDDEQDVEVLMRQKFKQRIKLPLSAQISFGCL